MPVPISLSDGVRVARIDPNNNSLQVVDYEHSEIHAGSAYRITFSEVVGSGNSASLSWNIIDVQAIQGDNDTYTLDNGYVKFHIDEYYYDELAKSGNSVQTSYRYIDE